jgi:hypothetical protein
VLAGSVSDVEACFNIGSWVDCMNDSPMVRELRERSSQLRGDYHNAVSHRLQFARSELAAVCGPLFESSLSRVKDICVNVRLANLDLDTLLTASQPQGSNPITALDSLRL